MNSFTFLENAYPSVYGNLLMGGQASWQLAGQLLAGATYMNTDPNSGTSVANWVSGKVNYINNFAPNTTTFAGMGTGGYPCSMVATRRRISFCNSCEMVKTWRWPSFQPGPGSAMC